MNCGTAIVITTSFGINVKRQRKEKFRGAYTCSFWLDIKSKQMNRSAY